MLQHHSVYLVILRRSSHEERGLKYGLKTMSGMDTRVAPRMRSVD